MPTKEVWSDVKVLSRVGPVRVASAGFYASYDDTKPLPTAFSILSNLRVFGIQIGATTAPLANGPINMNLSAGPWNAVLSGRIDDWREADRDHNPIVPGDATWSAAEGVGFKVTAVADVTLPLDVIIAAIPGIGWLAKAAAALGQKVKVSIAHDDEIIPIHRDATGKVVFP